MSDEVEMVTTSMRLPRPSLAALRSAAVARANEVGGRASIGKAVDDLVQRYCADVAKGSEA
jgi:hypothetical protein